ncbi:MAG: hypothetical protein ACK55I_17795 [bacterium]
MQENVRDGVGNPGAALTLAAAPLFHKLEKLVGDGSDGGSEVADDLPDNAVNGGTHQVKGVIHVSDVAYLCLADDDAKPLGTGLKLLNACSTLAEERS